MINKVISEMSKDELLEEEKNIKNQLLELIGKRSSLPRNDFNAKQNRLNKQLENVLLELEKRELIP